MSIVFNKHNPKSFVVRGELIENLKSRQKLILQLSGKCVYNTRLKFGSGLLVPINEKNEKILQNFAKSSNENSVMSPSKSCENVDSRSIIKSDLNSENSSEFSVDNINSKDKETATYVNTVTNVGTNRLQSVMIPYKETIDDEYVSQKNIETNSVLKQDIDDLLLKLINDSDDEQQISETTQQLDDRQRLDDKQDDMKILKNTATNLQLSKGHVGTATQSCPRSGPSLQGNTSISTNRDKDEIKMHTFNIVHNINLKETENMKNKNQKKQHKEKQVSIIDNKTNSFKMSNVNREKNMDMRSTKKGNNRDDKKTKNANDNQKEAENDRNNITEDSRQRSDSKKMERENSPRVSSRNAEKYERERRERDRHERNEREKRYYKRRSRHESSSESSSETSSSESSSDSSDESEYSGDSSEDERIQKTIRRKGQRPDRRQVELNDSDVDSDHEDVVTLSRRVRYLIRKIRSIEDYLRK